MLNSKKRGTATLWNFIIQQFFQFGGSSLNFLAFWCTCKARKLFQHILQGGITSKRTTNRILVRMNRHQLDKKPSEYNIFEQQLSELRWIFFLGKRMQLSLPSNIDLKTHFRKTLDGLGAEGPEFIHKGCSMWKIPTADADFGQTGLSSCF